MVGPSEERTTHGAGESGPGSAPGDPDAFGADWPTKAADVVDLVVDTVHDKFIRPVVLAARGVVFGLIIGVLGVSVLVLFCIMALRFLDVYVSHGHVWISYFILGGLFSIAGAVLWVLRSTPAPRPTDA